MRKIEDRKEKKTNDVFSNLTSKMETLTTLNLKIPTREKEAIKTLVEKINKEETPIAKVKQVHLMMTAFKLLAQELEKTPYHRIVSKIQ